MRSFLAAFFSAAGALASGDTATFQLTLHPTLPGAPPIASRFIGFSIEVGSTPGTFNAGGLGGSPRGSLASLFNALREASGDAQGPNVRVGGNSADESAYIPSGPLPNNITYRITDADLQAYATAVSQWNGTITLDTQLRYADRPALDTAHVRAALSLLGPALEKVEIVRAPNICSQKKARDLLHPIFLTLLPPPYTRKRALAPSGQRARPLF
jgi:PPE-repeat protein